MKTSEKTTTLFKALLEVQKELRGFVEKDAANPFFKSEYASMKSVIDRALPVLNDKEILVVQDAQTSRDGVGVTTLLSHIPSGEWLKTSPLFIPSAKKDAQGYGSAEAYARRYQLLPLLFLCPADKEDDDGAAAAKSSVNERIKETPPAKPENEEMTTPQKRKFFAMCNDENLSKPEQESFRSWLKEKCFKQDPISRANASILIENFKTKVSEWRAANGGKTYEEKLATLTAGYEEGDSKMIDALKACGFSNMVTGKKQVGEVWAVYEK